MDSGSKSLVAAPKFIAVTEVVVLPGVSIGTTMSLAGFLSVFVLFVSFSFYPGAETVLFWGF